MASLFSYLVGGSAAKPGTPQEPQPFPIDDEDDGWEFLCGDANNPAAPTEPRVGVDDDDEFVVVPAASLGSGEGGAGVPANALVFALEPAPNDDDNNNHLQPQPPREEGGGGAEGGQRNDDEEELVKGGERPRQRQDSNNAEQGNEDKEESDAWLGRQHHAFPPQVLVGLTTKGVWGSAVQCRTGSNLVVVLRRKPAPSRARPAPLAVPTHPAVRVPWGSTTLLGVRMAGAQVQGSKGASVQGAGGRTLVLKTRQGVLVAGGREVIGKGGREVGRAWGAQCSGKPGQQVVGKAGSEVVAKGGSQIFV